MTRTTYNVGTDWGEANDAVCDECDEQPVAWITLYVLAPDQPEVVVGVCDLCHALTSEASCV